MTLYARFAAHLDAILDALEGEGALPSGPGRKAVAVEPPRDPSHGDLATNAAMVLAEGAGTGPRALAGLIARRLAELDEVDATEIAGPGFINIRLSPAVWRRELRAILAGGEAYGRSTAGAGRRVNVETVSANPAGPMDMGHCRCAVVGDALANLLEAAGWEVVREYHVSDSGARADELARSAHRRYLEALGRKCGEIPDGLGPGDPLKPVGEALAAEYGGLYADLPEAEWLERFRRRTAAAMLDLIRADLARLGVRHDRFTSGLVGQQPGAVDRAFALLGEKGLVYRGVPPPPRGRTAGDREPAECTLFRSTRYGDDQDRPFRKSDGSWTDFAAGSAHHMRRLETSDTLISVCSADDAGTVTTLRSAVKALAGRPALDVELVQSVRLLRAGERVGVPKRPGGFVPLAEAVEEVGRDVVRFAMLTRRNNARVDFDFAGVVEASKDNPVFCVQYAHTRIRSLLRRAAQAGIDASGPADLAQLDEGELALVRLAARFPRIVETAAQAREPHRIASYLGDLAAAFHAVWNRGIDDPSRRLPTEDNLKLTTARLELASATAQVIRNGLNIMGVAAAEEMK